MPVAGGIFPISGGVMPMTTCAPTPASSPLQPSPHEDDKNIAQDVPVPTQPVILTRRPCAESAVEAPLEVVPVPDSIDTPAQGVAVPAAKKRQYDLPPQQPWQPIPHLQPPLHPPALPASSSSPAALPPPDTTFSPMGQEGSSAQGEQLAVPPAASRSSSVALTKFYLDIAHAFGRAQAQVGDPQDYDFWNKMRQQNLVLWLDYTEEATSYPTLDVKMWGAVKYRRTFSADSCNMVQSVAIDHKKSPSVYQTSIPIHSDKGFFT